MEAALGGDIAALRLCLDRIAPARKDSPVAFEMSAMKTAADASAALGAVIDAVAGGELTPAEGGAIADLVEKYRRALETQELEARVAAMEERLAKASRR